ncbi:hypothetical protein BCR39DRAFT_518106 [Naematelia encephala]|uniref:T-cell immunomodulatory protein TIP C2 domain-containing protein n=1 Tax=Naematelia encephala TaxID=71784 RepID=A0A1Y2BGS6_9TREE|nr:hypothetical protein BCR39DRAFT_518106 [Naematelia encephala]
MKLSYFLAVITLVSPTYAIWPFKQKRFTAEALIDAGPLGLEDVGGRVVAVGDWDGDQHADLFVLSEDSKSVQMYLWNRDSFKFLPSHSITLSSTILNVIPGDFNHDGRLDLLIMYLDESGGWWGSKSERTGMEIYLGGGPEGGFQEEHWVLPKATTSQPMVFDADGTLRASLLGFEAREEDAVARTWLSNGSGMILQSPPLHSNEGMCNLANPHSSAFVDMDGDCRPDLVLDCETPHTTQRFIQIWLNRGSGGYELTRTYDLPRGSGALSFADMNRDGTIDIVFPTCSRRSATSGIGQECELNIAYNKQVPICSGEQAVFTGGDAESGTLKCRGWSDLCIADDRFELEFDMSSEYYSSIPLASLFPVSAGEPSLLLHVPGSSSIPLPLRPGDYNVDGYPDLIMTVSNDTAAPSGGIFGGSRGTGTQFKVLENVPCGKNVPGCGGNSKIKRSFKLGTGRGWESVDDIWDAVGASWLDVDADGTLDIMVHRTGEQDQNKVTFLQNNFYHDAFFLKAQVLNGACDGECQPNDGGQKYSSLGGSYSGAAYKLTVLDTLGRRGAQQVAQLPQTGYHALGTPYSFIGLGRTNNYVERLSVGTSLVGADQSPISTLDSLIPNSQLLINPPSPLSIPETEPAPPVKARANQWHSELYLHPGDWVPFVGAAVVLTVLILGGVVVALNAREKKEDERERRRALHAINFQAL